MCSAVLRWKYWEYLDIVIFLARQCTEREGKKGEGEKRANIGKLCWGLQWKGNTTFRVSVDFDGFWRWWSFLFVSVLFWVCSEKFKATPSLSPNIFSTLIFWSTTTTKKRQEYAHAKTKRSVAFLFYETVLRKDQINLYEVSNITCRKKFAFVDSTAQVCISLPPHLEGTVFICY